MTYASNRCFSCPFHGEVEKELPGICPICGTKLEGKKLCSDSIMGSEQRELKRKFLWALLLTVPLIPLQIYSAQISTLIPLYSVGIIELLVSTLVIWWIGLFEMKQGLGAYFNFRLHSLTLAATGVLIAYLYSVFKLLFGLLNSNHLEEASLNSLFFEPGALIMILILGGLILEGEARKKILDDVKQLKGMIPSTAHLVLEKEERKISIDDVKRGDVLIIKPNEEIPADGVVLEGQSWVNEMKITGEHLPLYKRGKDPVFQGSLNGNNALKISVERIGEETLLSRIIHIVSSSISLKTPLQEKMVRFATILAFLILLFSFVVFLFSLHFGATYYDAVCRAVSVLLVTSPLALVFSVLLPETVGVMVGVSNGILVHQREALEKMERVNTLVIGKSGALTEGRPLLTKIFAKFPFSENEVLRWGASVEASSPHPIGQSYVMGAKLKQIPLMKASNFQNLEGKGVIAKVDGSRVAVGNARLLEDLGIDIRGLVNEAEKLQKEGMTVSFIAIEDRAVGLLGVIDPLRYSAERALDQLRKKGIGIVLATGDSREVALSVGKRLSINEIASDLLLPDKMALVKKLEKEGREVAMAGDGENDESAMSQADVGIALGPTFNFKGGQSSVTLMKPDLKGIVRLRDLSRRTMRIVRENIGFLFIFNLIFIPLASGLFHSVIPLNISPFVSCVLMTLSILIVIGNSLRLRKVVLYSD